MHGANFTANNYLFRSALDFSASKDGHRWRSGRGSSGSGCGGCGSRRSRVGVGDHNAELDVLNAGLALSTASDLPVHVVESVRQPAIRGEQISVVPQVWSHSENGFTG